MVPASGSRKPATSRSSVVLPQPEGPSERYALLLTARQLVGETRRDRGRELDEVEDLAYSGPT